MQLSGLWQCNMRFICTIISLTLLLDWPIDIFSRIHWPQKCFLELHVWGCPVYVLYQSLADGKQIPHWMPQSQRMVSMRHSPKHASTVPLVLNPTTGAFSAQFNIFDDWFSTVAAGSDQLPDFNSPEWSNMFGPFTFQYPYDDEDLAALDGSDSLPSSIDVYWFQDVDAADILCPISALPISPPLAAPAFEDARSPVDVASPSLSLSSPMSLSRERLAVSDSAVPNSSPPATPMPSSREPSSRSSPLHSISRKCAEGGFGPNCCSPSTITNTNQPPSQPPAAPATLQLPTGGFGPDCCSPSTITNTNPPPSQPPAAPATLQLPTTSPSTKPSNVSMPSTSLIPNSGTHAGPTSQPAHHSTRSTRGMPPDWLTIHLSASVLARLPPPDFYGGLFTSIGFLHPASFKAAVSNTDTLTFDEAMADPD